jgi:hypothetical protein
MDQIYVGQSCYRLSDRGAGVCLVRRPMVFVRLHGAEVEVATGL